MFPAKFARIGSIGVCLGVAIAAAQTVSSEPSVALDDYVGTYLYSANTVLRVQREGDHLIARFTGETRGSTVHAQSATVFAYPESDARLAFATDEVLLKQNGQETRMPRVSEQRATEIESAVAIRVGNQAAHAMSEAALRRWVTDLQAGRVDPTLLSPQLVGALNSDLPRLQLRIAELGAPVAFQFKRVNASGADEYELRHDRGTSEWSVVVDDRGVITGATIPF